MKILSWNVAGIRACIKRGSLDFLKKGEWDIVCFQETKAEASEVLVPDALMELYPYRYWRSSLGIKQRKGLSGTAIWSKTPALRELDPPEFDVEGRVTALEFKKWILVTVYTPNSQQLGCERHTYRVTEWDPGFRSYLHFLNRNKPTVVCGDFNVAHSDVDVDKPEEYRNVCAGFLDDERLNFHALTQDGWTDSFRELHPGNPECYTYWNQMIPAKRKKNRGWRIDYFLVPKAFRRRILKADIHPQIFGSDHCPISLVIELRRQLRLVSSL